MQFHLMSMAKHMGGVAWGVVIVLFIMSMYSIAVMIERYFTYKKATDQSRKYVTMVDEKNLAQYRPVVLGPLYEGKRIIREGLNAGEQIIVNGQARVFMPGMPVVAEPAAPAAKTAAN